MALHQASNGGPGEWTGLSQPGVDDPKMTDDAEHSASAPSSADLTATRQAVANHGDLVFRLALTHTACKADAEDVFQEVFLVFHRKQPRLRDREHVKAWLIRTTLNCARRVAASSWRTRVVPMTAEQEDTVNVSQFEFQTATQDAIFRAIKALPEGQREVIHLYYFEDWPVAQVAQGLGLDVGAVKMRLSRGRDALRDQLKGEYFND